MRISVLIPVHNKWDLTLACLSSLAKTASCDLEVIVVDNGSTDATAQACPALGSALFGKDFLFSRQETNRNFAPACNAGAMLSTGDLLFFLNNDTVLLAGWLEPLLDRLASPPFPAVVGPLLLYPEYAGKKDRVQHLGIAFEPQFYPVHLYEGFPGDHPLCARARRFQALTGAALLMPRASFFDAGLFDEGFINGGEDVEFGLRLSSTGKILLCEPKSKIYHLASQTPGVHAHAEHNASLLKEKAVKKILPDLHLFAREDGYELALTPGLGVYLDLPARRKELLRRQADRLRDEQELEDLLNREPLCHYGYHKLAALYAEKKRFDKASETLFLACKMRRHPETAQKLAETADLARDERLRGYALNVLQWYANKNFAEIRESARFMASFTDKLNIPSLRALYSAWCENKETMQQYYRHGT